MRASFRIRKGPVIVVAIVLVALVVLALVAPGKSPVAPASQLAFSPTLDPGSQLPPHPAPNFTLTDQFDKPVSLSSYRGKVVMLAFEDAECTTVCPLTTTAMTEAKQMLGKAGSGLALVGVDANPQAIAVKDVRSYSELHGMTHEWEFGTGSKTQLQHIWKQYGIEVEIDAGQIDHTPALYMISRGGDLERVYLTSMSYSSVRQEAQILAREASQLLPGHPAVHSDLSYKPISAISPAQHIKVPLVSHGSLELGPGSSRLLLFFASWDQEVMDLKSHLAQLNAYETQAKADKLPQLVAVDEASVEPNSAALPHLLAQIHTPLDYPVAIDQSGRLADGYGVQDEPWMVLVSKSGNPLWYQDLSTAGWLSGGGLVKQVKAALDTASGSTSPAVVRRELAGSPAPLAAIHAQADQLIGNINSLKARLKALHGYPVVVNIWYSTCPPCRAEFGLLASASAQFGRRVAFLGADLAEPAADARAFLKQHNVSYPSYPISVDDVTALLPQGLVGTPTTIFYDAAGKRTVHSGAYRSQGSLNSDVNTYALDG